MIVPKVYFDEEVTIVDDGDNFLSGYVGPDEQRERDDKPRRPIGFRFEPPPPSPDWMLL